MAGSPITELPIGLTLMMNEVANSYLRKKRGSLKVVASISDLSFDKMVNDIIELGIQFEQTRISVEDGFALWRCTAARRVRGVILTGTFFVLQKESATFLITGEKNIFLKNVVLFITKNLFPKILRAYVTSEELLTLLNTFSQAEQVELRYNEFVYKKMFGEAYTDRRHEKRLDPQKYKLFQEAFKKAREQDGWLDRIRVFGGEYTFAISRGGIVRLYDGSFSSYYKYFMSQFVDSANARWKVFEKRGRSESPQKEVRPILVEFDTNVFEDLSTRKQFLQTVSAFSNCAYSVIHGGNPHLYVAILDRADNSSFTIRTYGPNSILLMPQIRTTKAALARFSKHLLDNFQEGKTKDFKV